MQLKKIIAAHTEQFAAQYDTYLLPGQRRALDAILACRSSCGEFVVECEGCATRTSIPLSCGHRACPQCQINLGGQWFDRQQQKLLPVNYFMVTFTIPAELRKTARHHQHIFYDLLFDAAATALKTMGANNHGMKLGMTGVLHTHTRTLDYHPHVHFIVAGGGIVTKNKTKHWKTLDENYLINEFSLAKIFRGILLKLLIDNSITFSRKLKGQWVAHVKNIGRGEKALRYLSRYLYRGVINQNNISAQGNDVSFSYEESKTKQRKTKTLSAPHFIWKLMQHVLPRGFRRVRDYGFLHANAKRLLLQVQLALGVIVTAAAAVKKPLCCGVCKGIVKVVHVLAQKIPLLFRRPMKINTEAVATLCNTNTVASTS